MYTKCVFEILYGIMRFETKQAIATATQAGLKRKREYEDSREERYNESDDHGKHYRSPTPVPFYLKLTEKPSSKSVTWSYRWRGQDTSQDIIEVGSDKRVYKLKFGGPSGTDPMGSFGCPYFGDAAKFTERKCLWKRQISILSGILERSGEI